MFGIVCDLAERRHCLPGKCYSVSRRGAGGNEEDMHLECGSLTLVSDVPRGPDEGPGQRPLGVAEPGGASRDSSLPCGSKCKCDLVLHLPRPHCAQSVDMKPQLVPVLVI